MRTDDQFRPLEEHAGKESEPGILSVSIFGGALAAVCCLIVPLLVSLGSTGAAIGSLDAFPSLTPYLIAGAGVLTVLAVAYVVYRRLRRPAPGCEPGDPCGPNQSGN